MDAKYISLCVSLMTVINDLLKARGAVAKIEEYGDNELRVVIQLAKN